MKKIVRYLRTTKHYKDRKCADNENPCSAHVVFVKLYKYNCTLAIPLSDYLPCTGKRGIKNTQLLNQISFFLNLTVCVKEIKSILNVLQLKCSNSKIKFERFSDSRLCVTINVYKVEQPKQ